LGCISIAQPNSRHRKCKRNRTMADILEGSSDHLHYAPLSTEQTRTICKHLQNQLDDLRAKYNALEKEKDLSDGLQKNLADDVNEDRARINDLIHDLDATKIELSGAKKEIHQVRINAQRLRSDLEDTNGNVGQLRDSHNKTSQVAQANKDGLERTNKALKQVRDMIEGKVQPDVEKLREELRKAEFDISGLKNTCDQLGVDAKTQAENLRGTHAMVRGVADNLAKTDSELGQLAQKTNDLGKGLGATKRTLDGTRNGLMQLQDNQVRTAAAVGDLQGGFKRMNDDAKLHKDRLLNTTARDNENFDELQRALKELAAAKEELARQAAQLGKLNSNQEVLAMKNDQMASQLEHTDMIARGAMRGLDQTNAVVLPNLALDPHVASNHEFARTRTPRMTPKGDRPRTPTLRSHAFA